MVDVSWEIHTKNRGTLQISGVTGDLNSITQGEQTSFQFRTVGDSPADGSYDLLVLSDESYTVGANTIEEYTQVTVRENGSLTVEEDGELIVSDGENLPSGKEAWRRIKEHTKHAGTYSINETLNDTQKYNERVPTDAKAESIVIGVEPSDSLKNKDVTGVWGIIDSGTDERNNPLTNYEFSVQVTILAEYADYADHDAVEADLASNL